MHMRDREPWCEANPQRGMFGPISLCSVRNRPLTDNPELVTCAMCLKSRRFPGYLAKRAAAMNNEVLERARVLFECEDRYVPVDEVAAALGVKRSSVHGIARRYGWERRR